MSSVFKMSLPAIFVAAVWAVPSVAGAVVSPARSTAVRDLVSPSPLSQAWCTTFTGEGSGGFFEGYVGLQPNLPVCGPSPEFSGAANANTRVRLPEAYGKSFWSGTLDGFQCVELADRWLAMAYGLDVLSNTNGDRVAQNYYNTYHATHPQMQLIASGTAGNQPEPGDVISFSDNSTFEDNNGGHVAVVVPGGSVNSSGSGSIYIAQENISSNLSYASQKLTVTHWSVSGEGYARVEWLRVAPYKAVTNGSFVSTGGVTYVVAGGAPLPVNCDVMTCTNVTPVSGLSGFSQYPANGTAVAAGPGPLYRSGFIFAGGAPLPVANWANVGSPKWTVVDDTALTRFDPSGPYSHVRQYPLNGTAVAAGLGPIYKSGFIFAGGSPLPVADWANVGHPTWTVVDGAALTHFALTGPYSHVLQYPTNGTAVAAGLGPLYKSGFIFAGGAPLPVVNWANVGKPVWTVVDGAALTHFAVTGSYSHVRQYPMNGTAVAAGLGPIYKSGFIFAGGAPLPVANWTNVGNPIWTVVDGAALTRFDNAGSFSHVRKYPLDGTFIHTTLPFANYRVAGAYAFPIDSCAPLGGCTDSPSVDEWNFKHLKSAQSHLNPTPLAGTIVETLPARVYWKFTAGSFESVKPTWAAVKMDDSSLAGFKKKT